MITRSFATDSTCGFQQSLIWKFAEKPRTWFRPWKRLKRRGQVVSGFEESLYAERAVRAGANGYLNKQESNEKLIEAIRVVMRGDCYLSEAMKQRMLARVVRRRTVGSSPAELLTNREMEIFRLIGSGMTTSAIANQLFLSPHTIDSHRENIKKKLGVRNAAELNRQAVQWVLEHG